MHPSFRTFVASLAAALMGLAVIGAPAFAAHAHTLTSGPTPSPTPPSTSTLSGPLGAPGRDVTFAIGPAVQVPSDHYFDGRPYISSVTKVGGVVRDAVAVANVSRKPVSLTIYPADATQKGSTNFDLSLKNQTPTSTGAWLSLKGKKRLVVTVPASHAGPNNSNIPGRVLIPFDARVPLAAEPGDHVAAIVAELDAPGRNKNGAAVTLQQRLGVAVYIHLTGAIRSGLQISHLKAHWNEPGNALGTSRYTVSYTVTNTGNVRMNVSTLLNTTRWFLGAIRRYPGEIFNLFPGSSIVVSVTVPHVFGFGPWKATASAFGTPVDPTIVVTTKLASESVGLWPIPWILIAIIVAIILLTYYAQRRYRRWRKDRKENPRVKGGQRSKKRREPEPEPKAKRRKPKATEAELDESNGGDA